MANIMSKRGTYDNVITYEHFCDTKEDMKEIDPQYITLGSVCVVLESTGVEMYIADSNQTWHQV